MTALKSLLPGLAALAAAVAAGTAPADAARSGWSDAGEAEMRLLLVPPPPGAAGPGSTIEGGIEIVLSPGWHTYWRTPGDVGIPPVFDFAGSTNVGEVEVRYPAPMRLADETGVSLVYENDVVLPLSVAPADPAQPVTLRLAARFGVCAEICVPAEVKAEVTLGTGAAADPLSSARVASFARRVPGAAEPARFAVESAVADGDNLDIAVRMPDSAYADLFAEPPAGWFVGQPAFVSRADGVSHFSLALAQRPPGTEIGGQTFRFVAVAGGAAIEQSVTAK